MVIHPIEGIERLIGSRRAERVKSAPKEHKEEKADALALSDEAKAAAPLIRFAYAAIEKAPEVRTEKLAQVQERLSSGFYLTRKVIEKIAENIARALGL